jgi:renalase
MAGRAALGAGGAAGPGGSAPRRRVALVGLGAAGGACAWALRELAGTLGLALEVHGFDKGRGVGGRMATRRALPGLEFRHGAQHVGLGQEPTNETQLLLAGRSEPPLVAAMLEELERRGSLATRRVRVLDVAERRGEVGLVSEPREATVLTATPTLSAPLKDLLVGLAETHLGVRVVRVVRVATGAGGPGDAAASTAARSAAVAAAREPGTPRWALESEDGRHFGPFDAVLVTVPLPQAHALWPAGPTPLPSEAQRPTRACWATMLALKPAAAGARAADLVRVQGAPLVALHRQLEPPEWGSTERWVAHASAAASLERVDMSAEAAAQVFSAEAVRLLAAARGGPPQAVEHASAHRWLYSSYAPGDCEGVPEALLSAAARWDPAQAVGYASDALPLVGESGGVFGALRSGAALARMVAEDWAAARL